MATYTFNGISTGISAFGTNVYRLGLAYGGTDGAATSFRLSDITVAPSGTRNSMSGGQTGVVNTANDVSFFGYSTGKANTTGNQNAFLGSQAGSVNTTGSNNTFVGYNTGKANTIGNYCSFFGSNAGPSSTGDDNSFFGVQAGFSNTSGTANVAFGEISGFFNTTGTNNCWIGLKAGYNYISASGNTVIGTNNTDATATTGSFNTFIGANTTGYGNVSNTVIISDGSNAKNIIADANNARFAAPVKPPSYTVGSLPSATTAGVGSIAYTTNGRKLGEAAAAGTGCPVYSSGSAWFTFYGNIAVTA